MSPKSKEATLWNVGGLEGCQEIGGAIFKGCSKWCVEGCVEGVLKGVLKGY